MKRDFESGCDSPAGVAPPVKKSRTRIKREAEALQALGEELTRLPPETLDAMGLPPDLAAAVTAARGMTRRGARRRQLQFIGRLMRAVDPAPIRRFLADRHRCNSRAAQAFKTAETWRDQLVSGSDAPLHEVRARFPRADQQRLEQLVGNARRGGGAGAGRQLFRFLFSLLSPPAADPEAPGQSAADDPG
ncbi:MAG: ribosome biogenesis factor YjgA [Desulfobacteraceae bacterium]